MRASNSSIHLGCLALAAVVGISCLLCGGWLMVGLREAAQHAAKPQPVVDHSPAKQQQRAALIGKLRASGVFNRIESRGRSLVRVWTGPAFADLAIQDKERFVGVVYAYYFDGSSFADAVILHDGRTGKEIGSYHLGRLSME